MVTNQGSASNTQVIKLSWSKSDNVKMDVSCQTSSRAHKTYNRPTIIDL